MSFLDFVSIVIGVNAGNLIMFYALGVVAERREQKARVKATEVLFAVAQTLQDSASEQTPEVPKEMVN